MTKDSRFFRSHVRRQTKLAEQQANRENAAAEAAERQLQRGREQDRRQRRQEYREAVAEAEAMMLALEGRVGWLVSCAEDGAPMQAAAKEALQALNDQIAAATVAVRVLMKNYEYR